MTAVEGEVCSGERESVARPTALERTSPEEANNNIFFILYFLFFILKL